MEMVAFGLGIVEILLTLSHILFVFFNSCHILLWSIYIWFLNKANSNLRE